MAAKRISFGFHLDNRGSRTGQYVIYIRITLDRKHKYVKTSVTISNKNWFNKNVGTRTGFDRATPSML